MAGTYGLKETTKCLVIPAAIVGVIQAAAWLFLSLVCILFYNDAIDVKARDASYGSIIYNIYLNPKHINSPLRINSKEFNIIMYFYMGLSFIFLLMSLYLCWVTMRHKWTNVNTILLYWSITILVTSVLDLSLMGVLARDLAKEKSIVSANSEITSTTSLPTSTTSAATASNSPATTSTSAATSLLSREANAKSSDNFNPQDIYTAIGIVMTVAARGYILWIVNVVFGIGFLVATIQYMREVHPSMQRPIINAYSSGPPRPLTLYDQIDIDNSYQNRGFEMNETSFHNSQPPSTFIHNHNVNPLSNGNRNNFIPRQTPARNFEQQPIRPSAPYSQNGKLAKIGKPGGRRTPPRNVPSPVLPSDMPYIPDPDYTPPSTPKPKSNLRQSSNYVY